MKFLSRRKRFANAMNKLLEAKSEFEALKEEMENWSNNLPENLQNGDRFERIDNAFNELDEICTTLEDIEGKDIEFPSMFG